MSGSDRSRFGNRIPSNLPSERFRNEKSHGVGRRGSVRPEKSTRGRRKPWNSFDGSKPGMSIGKIPERSTPRKFAKLRSMLKSGIVGFSAAIFSERPISRSPMFSAPGSLIPEKSGSRRPSKFHRPGSLKSSGPMSKSKPRKSTPRKMPSRRNDGRLRAGMSNFRSFHSEKFHFVFQSRSSGPKVIPVRFAKLRSIPRRSSFQFGSDGRRQSIPERSNPRRLRPFRLRSGNEKSPSPFRLGRPASHPGSPGRPGIVSVSAKPFGNLKKSEKSIVGHFTLIASAPDRSMSPSKVTFPKSIPFRFAKLKSMFFSFRCAKSIPERSHPPQS